ncbi:MULTISPECIES: hypothetical protein [unclassified Pseudactinotalea]|uniref:hypothetical protein n=1 Tax=unclassified Pseudactinotalea TaxID=2649176 RepID=UPI00128E37A7|nr:MULTISPECIES: hypothetical protein [unclassified Pseudactinotalea]MPV51235.1 hypothetical protein [Pseudactinotalea sp. HY160]QGH69682.1 hypothetical protein GCE65_09285 [Pseudactinotalea sp. HY158]
MRSSTHDEGAPAAPASRTGLAGAWDSFVGPGQTRVERWGTVTAVAAAAVAGDRALGDDATPRHRVALRLAAVDLWGGAWVNNTRACVRWYERPGQGPGSHAAFAALHIAHAATIAGVDTATRSRSAGSALTWTLAHFTFMLGASTLVAFSPRRRRLPLALGASLAGLALDRSLGPSASAPWFAPIYYTKLLVGHAAGSIWNAGPVRRGNAITP